MKDILTEYNLINDRAVHCKKMCRQCGLLVLDDIVDEEKLKQKDILEYGIKFLAHGVDIAILNKILDKIISLENDDYKRILKNIQKLKVMEIYFCSIHNPNTVLCISVDGIQEMDLDIFTVYDEPLLEFEGVVENRKRSDNDK
jgi:hypothetical protein